MSIEQESADADKYLSARDMSWWLKDELRNVTKECELRIREATELATAYSIGDLTPKQADELYIRYQNRWDLPLMGLGASNYSSDEAIIKALDKARERARSIDTKRNMEQNELEERLHRMEQRLSRFQRIYGDPSEEPPGHSR
jgi:hypothetical protein